MFSHSVIEMMRIIDFIPLTYNIKFAFWNFLIIKHPSRKCRTWSWDAEVKSIRWLCHAEFLVGCHWSTSFREFQLNPRHETVYFHFDEDFRPKIRVSVNVTSQFAKKQRKCWCCCCQFFARHSSEGNSSSVKLYQPSKTLWKVVLLVEWCVDQRTRRLKSAFAQVS